MNHLPAYRKTFAAVAGAVIAFAQVVIYSEAEAISATEWVTGAILILTALGVYTVPNEQS